MGSAIANIGGDANGALAIYDLLTNDRYGLGILPGRIDATSFEYTATFSRAKRSGSRCCSTRSKRPINSSAKSSATSTA